MALGNRVVAQSAERGALPTLFAATADRPAGTYAGPEGAFEIRGEPTLVGRTRAASDPQLAARLWTASAEPTGGDIPPPPARRARAIPGGPARVGRTRAASDPQLAARLWTASAELTGVDFPAPLPARV